VTKAPADFEVLRQSTGVPTLVVFGGLAEGFAVPPYEFARFVERLPECNVVFLRDRHQLWYQRGVRGLGATVEAASLALADLVASMAGRRVVLTGNSAGGFGALQAAAVIPDLIDRVVVFSPQTVLTEVWRRRWRDPRWPEQTAAVHRLVGALASDRLDLKPRLQSGPLPPTRIHFAGFNRLDALHALRLAGTRNVALRPHARRSHSLVKSLRDDGKLIAILDSALNA
jgi:pimeloyl-ACP methyl ester carboxylesterase